MAESARNREILSNSSKATARIPKTQSRFDLNADDLIPILDAIKEGLIVLDRRGILLFANRHAKSILAISDLRAESLPFGIPMLSENNASVEIFSEGQSRSVMLRVIVSPNNRRNYYVVEIKDRTESLAAERRIARLEKSSARHEAEKKDLELFTHIMAHDFRDMVQSISAAAEMLDEAAKVNDHKLLEGRKTDIVNLAHQLSDLLRDVYAFSTSGLNSIPTERFAANESVQLALTALDVQIQKTKAVIVCKSLPEIVGSKNLLSLVFQNLISNGIKFNRSQRPQVVVRGLQLQGHAIFSVRDNGVGISETDLPRMLSETARFHESEGFAGTGLGLLICRRIVEAHGGKIWVRSKIGRGTVVYFSIASSSSPSREFV